jgi:hypothetical protein
MDRKHNEQEKEETNRKILMTEQHKPHQAG